MSNPYDGLPAICFWSKAVTWPARGHVDPVTNSPTIARTDKIATMGSCFAQHISRHLQRAGLPYLITEASPQGMDPDEARRKGYGLFSARYGNVYTARQAVQLFDRAFGLFAPADDVWEDRNGRLVDAFRPTIEPEGFSSCEQVRSEARRHLECVRRVFLDCDWLIVTLGLTESWRSKRDGAVYPLAPGVRGGRFDPNKHEYINFAVGEVRDDLFSLITKIREVNSKARILLTVSPVPLVATFEKRHVLVSTTVSKSVLRVAVDEAVRQFPDVHYFPSYEIVTSTASDGRYLEDDLRSVSELGVRHVMKLFDKHFLATRDETVKSTAPTVERTHREADVVCDEEWIERARQISGF